MKTILLSQAIHPKAMEMLEGRYNILLPELPGQEAFERLLSQADALILRTNLRLTEEALKAAAKLKMIARIGVGLDNVPLQAIKERGIVLTYTPNANSVSVAEHTVAMLLALAKYMPQYDKAVRTGGWDMRLLDLPVELYGKTAGIIGMGRIGKLTADILHNGFKMPIIACGPHIRQQDYPAYEVTQNAAEVFQKSDFVCLHCPSNDATRGMVNASLLRVAKRGMVLINCARGDILVEADLAKALEDGTLAAAGLDVFTEEPPAPENSLRRLPNVLLSPHAAALTKEASIRMATTAAEQVHAFFANGRPDSVVEL